jgi:tetratricopeptide (TPR) repeat protein
MLYLSMSAFALGNLQAAEEILVESNSIAEGKLDRWAQATGLDLLGQVLVLKGQTEEASNLFLQSQALFQEIGDAWGHNQSLIHLAGAKAPLQETDEAKDLFRRAYRNAKAAKWTPTILEALVGLISLDERVMPEKRLAVTLSILSHPAVTPSIRQQAEGLKERLTSALSPRQVLLAEAQAESLDPEVWNEGFLPRI